MKMNNYQIFPFDVLYEIGIHLKTNDMLNLVRTSKANKSLFILLIPYFIIDMNSIPNNICCEITNKITQLINASTLIRQFINIKRLTFSNESNQPIDNLPNKITHLTLGRSFNQSIKNLPITITHLNFNYRFK